MFTVIATQDDKSSGTQALELVARIWQLTSYCTVVYLFRSRTQIINGISGPVSTTACRVKLPREATLVDFKFLDDTGLLILCTQKGLSDDRDG
jgi:hypothetical protein